MSVIRRILLYSFQAVLFVVAIGILFYTFRTYNNLYAASYNFVLSDHLVSDNAGELQQHNIMRSEILAMLMMDKIEYDIEIIDKNKRYVITVDTHSPDNISSYSLDSNFYRKTYVYDYSGNTLKIVYEFVD